MITKKYRAVRIRDNYVLDEIQVRGRDEAECQDIAYREVDALIGRAVDRNQVKLIDLETTYTGVDALKRIYG